MSEITARVTSSPVVRAPRHPVFRIVDPWVEWLIRRGVRPNDVTTAGFLFALLAGAFYHFGHVRVSGALILLGGVADILDGRLAQIGRLGSKFGAFYDSTLDRIGEMAVWLGLLSLSYRHGFELAGSSTHYVIVLALGTTQLVSYVRAKAEALGIECSVGVLQRRERVVLLGGASLAFGGAWNAVFLNVAVVVIAAFSIITVIQRIVWVYGRSGSRH
jgi:CDP-diacylglycerol--glycerol-3-phosphate 3-phosphatidyltransferase